MRPRVPVVLGTSGADSAVAQAEVMQAGGDGFLEKPITSLAHFQNAIMAHLPADKIPASRFPAFLCRPDQNH